MDVESIILLIMILKCTGELRRQFDHYKEFLAENEKKALRQTIEDHKHYYQKKPPQIGPKKNLSYNPRYGYEPYWPSGDWVFNETDNTNRSNSSSKCFKVYEKYGPVCAVSIENVYKSFSNVCEVRNQDCHDHHMWRIIHRGPCNKEFGLYPDSINDLDSLKKIRISEVRDIIASFYQKYNISRRYMRGLYGHTRSFLAKDNIAKLHRRLH